MSSLSPLLSTYRVQLHAKFTFRDAAALVPYLYDLGITHLYCSPILRAKPGSTHGYDVIDHCRLNPELGTEADFDALARTLSERGMSMIVDIVPNHVGVATNDNAWWNDVLAHGRESKYARHFDIDWDCSTHPELHGTVLLPVLGKSYGDVLDAGELKLSRDGDQIWVNYYERRFPISPEAEITQPGDSLNSAIARLNSDRDALHALLETQHYRLACWRTASDEINYRRFFDVNDLAALAMDRKEVFDETHALTIRLIREGKIAGLRLDHPDGLYDPAAYFEQLRSAVNDKDFYILAEKILAMDEALPKAWPIDGTTGYDFLAHVNALFVASGNETNFTRIYSDFVGNDTAFDELAYRNKKLILRIALASELHVLAHRFDQLAQRDTHWRDFTLKAIWEALAEIIACFDVYRTYIASSDVSTIDQAHVNRAIGKAIARNPRLDPSVFKFIADVLLQRYPAELDADARAEQLRIVGKFQQLTSPTTAKGIEDTTFYQYHRLISLNEVGGEPSKFGVSADALHKYFADRQSQWPRAMSTLSTHDTKRSEDVRGRINVLSHIPDEWNDCLQRWRDLSQPLNPPEASELYLLFQTLLGAWPAGSEDASHEFVERIQAFMIKAMREGKVRSLWTQPDEAYEKRVNTFVERLLVSREFLADFLPFAARVAEQGRVNSLAQTLIKLTAPGIPDTYQGTEAFDFSLVDPDNRRPVDYERRRALLDSSNLDDDDAMKVRLTHAALQARRDRPALFLAGDYIPLKISGAVEHFFAFARRHGNEAAVIVVPRAPSASASAARVELPSELQSIRWVDALNVTNTFEPGDSLPLNALLKQFPVGFLLSKTQTKPTN